MFGLQSLCLRAFARSGRPQQNDTHDVGLTSQKEALPYRKDKRLIRARRTFPSLYLVPDGCSCTHNQYFSAMTLIFVSAGQCSAAILRTQNSNHAQVRAWRRRNPEMRSMLSPVESQPSSM